MASLSDETEARMNDLLALSHSGGETDPMSYDDLMKSKLREKYDGLVSGLLEKVEIENKAYMDRKLESMEKDIVRESYPNCTCCQSNNLLWYLILSFGLDL